MPIPTASILILFAHPALERSRVNTVLVDAVRDVDGVTVNDLYEQYPDLRIDVEREQRLLAEHDVVVLQHPLYWYSSPAIIKEYLDLVLGHGWAYGHGGGALMGTDVLQAVSVGAGEQAYRRDGFQRYTLRELLAPFDQTAHLCRMNYLPPFVVYGSLGLSPSEISAHAADYRELLIALRDGAIDRDALDEQEQLNSPTLLNALRSGANG